MGLPTLVVVDLRASPSADPPLTERLMAFRQVQPTGDGTHRLTVDTKYYTADVSCCQLAVERQTGALDLSDCGDVLILHVDADFPSGCDADALVASSSARVRLLVCERLSAERRDALARWAVAREFDAIELNPDEQTRRELRDDYGELVGFERLWQAVCAHAWPNAQIKEHAAVAGRPARGDGDAACDPWQAPDAATPSTSSTPPSQLAEPSFEDLFAKFSAMKEHAQGLPVTERKAYAADVATAFLRAFDEDEDSDDVEQLTP